MDFLVRHWAPYARRFPSGLPLLNMGDIREKDHWVRKKFSTCNFSFILRGRGEFHRQGKVWKIEAPCVITQWPDEPLSYGPTPRPEGTWDEVYLIYDARTMPLLRRRGFVDARRPVWPIANPDGVLAPLAELRRLTKLPRPADAVDQADLLCERMILESLLPLPGAPAGNEDEAVRVIEAQLRRAPEKEFDFDRLAGAHGMSPSTLRRRWKQAFAVPPAKYHLDLRMQKARRLLVESPARIGEIAAGVGFEDLLYFSRRFRLSTGLAPSEYRKRYRLRPR